MKQIKHFSRAAIVFTLLFLTHALCSTNLLAQSVGINKTGNPPAASALLDIDASGYTPKKGLLIPRMTAAERTAIVSPATGLMVFQTDATAGFYYYNGTAWVSLSGSAGITPLANGGTNASLTAVNGGIVWSTASSLSVTPVGTSGQVLTSGGAGIPTWTTPASSGQASIITATSGINTTETVVIKTAALPVNRLVAGTVIRVTLLGTCTSTGANTSTFALRFGTAGTTADGLIASAVTSAAATSGTNVPFRAVFEFIVRTVGTSATGHGFLSLANSGTTGISSTSTGDQIILPTFTSFNTTTGTIISATYKSALSTTTSTFQDAFIEIVYK